MPISEALLSPEHRKELAEWSLYEARQKVDNARANQKSAIRAFEEARAFLNRTNRELTQAEEDLSGIKAICRANGVEVGE